MLHSSLLSQFPWLSHRFGTRDDAPRASENAATLTQTHSADVWLATRAGCIGAGDGLIGNQPGLDLSIRTADCYPVLLVDTKQCAVAALHAGWRGTVGKIVMHAMDKMRQEFGTRPEDVYAAIGPGIGVCCFEVGPEVERFFDSEFVNSRHVNLPEANRAQLISAGVASSCIDVVGLCTSCNEGKFYSHRRETKRAQQLHLSAPKTGRMISFVGIV